MHSEGNIDMKDSPKRRGGILAGIAAVASALLLAIGAVPAHAEPVTIDPTATGSLIIHKFLQPGTVGEPSTGLPQDTDGLTPLAGIQFTAQRVGNIDLTTNRGWVEAGELSVEDAANQLTGTPYVSAPSDANGLATIGNLPVGLYYVTETVYGPEVTPAVPFVVAVPTTNPEALNTWLYDVHVYPKNATSAATKSVQDAATVKLGDAVQWTILADIPRSATINRYAITDDLDPRLTYVDAAVTLTEGAALVAEDYTLDLTDGTVTVEFTASGRAKLVAAWRASTTAQVQVVLDTTANAVGEIANTATVFPNITSTGVSTTPVISKWGSVVLEKVDSRDVGTKLAGAEFQVFLSEADADANINPIRINEGLPSERSVFVSDSDGIVRIEGLRYSNWANGVELSEDDANYLTYWVAETKAPTGYELLGEPIEVTVTSAEDTVSIEVQNVTKNAGFELPMTGASGASTIIMIAGILLLVVGTTAVVVSRRKKNHIKA